LTEVSPAALVVEQTIRIEAPRDRVFALTDAVQIGRWMPVTTFEPRIGGRFEFGPQNSWSARSSSSSPRAWSLTPGIDATGRKGPGRRCDLNLRRTA
jgi:hypothetical protein